MLWIVFTALVLQLFAGSVSAQAPSAAGAAPLATPPPSPLTLNVKIKTGVRNKTAPLLYGLFFEDINRSGDGGIYAELIRNRAFQDTGSSAMTGWRAVGGAKISLDKSNRLSDALTTVLKVEIPSNAAGDVGFLNEGWWGIDVRPQPYSASFYVKGGSGFPGNVTGLNVSLRSNSSNDVWAQQWINFDGKNVSESAYAQLQTVLNTTAKAPSVKNTFAITFKGEEAAGQTFFFSLISLFPPTFKNRPNGLRLDLAQDLMDLRPKFLRFPGGNNLEGNSVATRWQWKKNIGPLINRAGRPGTWGYYNTDGLGYLEYLEWCEDMGIEPLLTVYAGYSLGSPGTTVPQNDLDIYIQEAIEQLEYAMGGPDTKWGALRAQHGHPEPFNIKFVEIGNEDWFSDSYYWRFPRFLSGLKAKYPNIIYISSQATESSPANRNVTIPPGSMWDLHHYETPQFFKDRFNFFDNWQRIAGYPNVTIFVGEYAVLSVDRPGGVDWNNGVGRLKYPGMLSAIGEAIFSIAMERNPDVVTLSSYAPLFQNFNDFQWTPDFISYTADPAQTVRSTSYWKQWMYARAQGTQTVQVVNEKGGFNPVWWHASAEPVSPGSTAEKIFVKLVNASPVTAPISIVFEGASSLTSVNITRLTHKDELAYNYLGNATIAPQMSAITDLGSVTSTRDGSTVLNYQLPGLSVEVLEVLYS